VFTTPTVTGATSYVWTLPSGATGSSTTNSITLSFSSTYNSGTLSVKAVGPCGTSANFSRTVYSYTTAPVPPASISGQNTGVCAGSTKTYTCPSVVTADSYQWTVPTNSTIVSGQGTQTITVQYGSNFTTSGTMSVRSQNCFGLSSPRSWTIYSIPSTPGSISGSTNNLCPGSSFTYSITAIAGASGYTWTAPANTTISAGQGTTSITLVIGSSFTSGTLSVVATSACGQSADRTLGLSKSPATLSAMSGQTSNLCGGGQFTYSITAVAAATAYNWTVPAGCSIATNSGNSIVLNIPSTFTTGTLSVQVVNACGASATRSASLTRLPAIPASITGPASVCPSQVGVNFTTPAVTGVTQSWTVPTGAVITAGQGTTSMTCNWGTSAGSVTVKSVNACGQSSARSKSVTLATCIEETGGDFMREPELEAFPNPNNGTFVVRANEAGDFYLMNSLGQVVQVIKLNASNNLRFELSGMTSGIYFLSGTVKGANVTERIVVTGN
ncbi:MAG: T9SS type A sorting domain-containing protein, partial [Flavobacteriales bacterium]